MRTIKIGGLALMVMLGACSNNSGDANNMAMSSMPNAADAPNSAAMVQPLPAAASNDYPPCSARVKDHCVEK